MHMIELSAEYLNDLMTQLVFISVFLGGFSASILGTLITTDKKKSKVLSKLIIGSSLAALSFIVAVFAMTNIIIVTIPTYPLPYDGSSVSTSRAVGFASFIIGILSILFVIGTSGWLYSRKLGIFTTVIGVLGLIAIIACT